ncbi:MAG: hypothetical protein JW959_09870 [Pirellulales bacterium]|nr:hypothetical protein [Pirellulales bacterium]
MELNWLSLLGLSLGLAMDASAMSIAVGMALQSVTPRRWAEAAGGAVLILIGLKVLFSHLS